MTAQEFGHHKIFKIKLSNGHISEIVKNGGNSALSFVIDGPGVGSLIFLRSTPVLAPEVFSVNLNDADGDGVEPPTRRNTMDPVQLSRFNYETLLSTLMSEPEEFWFNGFNDEPVMGWLFKPSKFSIKETYPLAFLVHGGPESAWNADFSFRWNPQVYAGAGYAVVAINFHG